MKKFGAWPWGYKTWVHSQAQNKAQWFASCGHVSTSCQSLHFILSLRLYSSFITPGPGQLALCSSEARQSVSTLFSEVVIEFWKKLYAECTQ